MNNYPNRVSRLLRSYRVSFNLTQEDLALKINRSKRFVSDLENDLCFPDLPELIHIALALHEPVPLYVRVWFDQRARNTNERKE